MSTFVPSLHSWFEPRPHAGRSGDGSTTCTGPGPGPPMHSSSLGWAETSGSLCWHYLVVICSTVIHIKHRTVLPYAVSTVVQFMCHRSVIIIHSTGQVFTLQVNNSLFLSITGVAASVFPGQSPSPALPWTLHVRLWALSGTVLPCILFSFCINFLFLAFVFLFLTLFALSSFTFPFFIQPNYFSLQVNGTVCPSKASSTPTLASRLHTLWRHISKSRTHFETTPDTGKTLTPSYR